MSTIPEPSVESEHDDNEADITEGMRSSITITVVASPIILTFIYCPEHYILVFKVRCGSIVSY